MESNIKKRITAKKSNSFALFIKVDFVDVYKRQMCICTVLFLVVASHMTRRYAGQKTSFSFLSGYSGINLKGNIFPSLIPCTGKDRSDVYKRQPADTSEKTQFQDTARRASYFFSSDSLQFFYICYFTVKTDHQ